MTTPAEQFQAAHFSPGKPARIALERMYDEEISLMKCIELVCEALSTVSSEAQEPVALPRSQPTQTGVGKFCHPGPPDEQKQLWLLMYDDNDRGYNLFDDAEEARAQFAESEGRGWNCHLFTSALRDCAAPVAPQPIDMILYCPNCRKQHIDRPDLPDPYDERDPAWTNPPHRSHLCRREDGGCGHIWRPADVPTNGVATIKTKGKNDSAAPQQAKEAVAPHIVEALSYHAFERDDLTLDEAVEAIRHGWKKVRGRTERELVLQIASLLASAPVQTAQVSAQPQEAEREEFCARFFPPPGYEDHCVVESRGFLVWMKREDIGPDDSVCFYDGDYRDVLKPDDPRLAPSPSAQAPKEGGE